MGRAVEAASAFTDDEDDSEDEEEEEEEEEEEVHEEAPPADGAASDADEPAAAPPTPAVEPSTPTPTPPTRVETYYFYQADDGQPVVLHSACTRVLLAHFGSYERLPASFEAVVVELEERAQDEDARRRAVHLRHLPLTTSYTLAEVDLTGVVPAEMLKQHGEELRAREKLRRKRANAEARAAAAAADADARAARDARVFSTAARDAMPALGSAASAPREDDDDASSSFDASRLTPEEALARAHAAAEEEAREAAREAALAREEFENAEGPRGTSFARVAQWGFASGLDAPDLPGDGESWGPALGASPPAARGAGGVWGGGGGRRVGERGRRRRRGGRRRRRRRRRVGRRRRGEEEGEEEGDGSVRERGGREAVLSRAYRRIVRFIVTSS